MEDKRFKEAPKLYLEDWKDSFMGDNIKLWYNIDLFNIADYIEDRREDPEFISFYNEYCKTYGITMSITELKNWYDLFDKEFISECYAFARLNMQRDGKTK